MSINDDVIPLNCDGEKRFLSMSKPTKDDLDLHDCYELSSALHTPAIHPSRRSKKTMHEDTPMIEWHRRLAMAPEDIVSKTLQHTTQHYLNVDCENRSNMHEHYQSRFPGLRLPRQKEGVATDTHFHPSKPPEVTLVPKCLWALLPTAGTPSHLRLNPTMDKHFRTTLAKLEYLPSSSQTMPRARQAPLGPTIAVIFALAPKRLNQVTLGKTHASTESVHLLTWSRLTSAHSKYHYQSTIGYNIGVSLATMSSAAASSTGKTPC